jgi:hypothetical protein
MYIPNTYLELTHSPLKLWIPLHSTHPRLHAHGLSYFYPALYNSMISYPSLIIMGFYLINANSKKKHTF